MHRDPSALLRYLTGVARELRQNEYPTNGQVQRALRAVREYPPMIQHQQRLSERGQRFWTDLRAWLLDLARLIASKNKGILNCLGMGLSVVVA